VPEVMINEILQICALNPRKRTTQVARASSSVFNSQQRSAEGENRAKYSGIGLIQSHGRPFQLRVPCQGIDVLSWGIFGHLNWNFCNYNVFIAADDDEGPHLLQDSKEPSENPGREQGGSIEVETTGVKHLVLRLLPRQMKNGSECTIISMAPRMETRLSSSRVYAC
jgi:hypothetical protein